MQLENQLENRLIYILNGKKIDESLLSDITQCAALINLYSNKGDYPKQSSKFCANMVLSIFPDYNLTRMAVFTNLKLLPYFINIYRFLNNYLPNNEATRSLRDSLTQAKQLNIIDQHDFSGVNAVELHLFYNNGTVSTLQKLDVSFQEEHLLLCGESNYQYLTDLAIRHDYQFNKATLYSLMGFNWLLADDYRNISLMRLLNIYFPMQLSKHSTNIADIFATLILYERKTL